MGGNGPSGAALRRLSWFRRQTQRRLRGPFLSTACGTGLFPWLEPTSARVPAGPGTGRAFTFPRGPARGHRPGVGAACHDEAVTTEAPDLPHRRDRPARARLGVHLRRGEGRPGQRTARGVRWHPLRAGRRRDGRAGVRPLRAAETAAHLAGVRRAHPAQRGAVLQPADPGDPRAALGPGRRADLPAAGAGRRAGGTSARRGADRLKIVGLLLGFAGHRGGQRGRVPRPRVAARGGVRRVGCAGLGAGHDRLQAVRGPASTPGGRWRSRSWSAGWC